MPVQIEAVKSVPLRDATEYVGVLRSRQSVQIQPLVEGHVSKILVTSGNEVQPGVPLIDIDPSRQRAAVNSQQALHQGNVASLDLARKQYARIERLFNRGAATRQDFDQAQNGLRQAEANASATKAHISEPVSASASQPPPTAMTMRSRPPSSGQARRPAPCDAK